MSNQTALSPGNSIVQIEVELEKLFVFQDKHLSREKKAIIVNEILNANLPIGAVIQGIRSLMMEDLGSIKLGTLMHAIRKHVFKNEDDAESCSECASGFLIMFDDQGRYFALACHCPAGQVRGRAHRIVGWKGLGTQHSNGRMLCRR